MRRRFKIHLITFIVLLSLFTTFLLVYSHTSEPEFCSSCHFIAPYVASWKNQPHREVKCLFCHENRGFLGKIDSKSRGTNYVYMTITNQYSSFITEGKIFPQNCVACHIGDNKKYPQAKILDSTHIDYMKQNRSCPECHQNPGHEINIFK